MTSEAATQGTLPAAGPPPRRTALSGEALDFAPSLLAIQERPPAPLSRAVLYALCALAGIFIAWACVGKLDIIATAEGRLIPGSYVKIVQPAEAGIVREILVHEGESVQPGQVLMRMDRQEAEADTAATATALAARDLQVRRIDAELSARPLVRRPGESEEAFQQVATQLAIHQQAHRDAIGQAEESLRRAENEAESGRQTLEKLRMTNPIYRKQAQTYSELGKDGYVTRIAMDDKQREFIENSQELKAQEARVASLEASVAEAKKQLSELASRSRSDLQNERIEAAEARSKLQQEMIKQTHQAGLLELRATGAGIVKDLATHTIGTVVAAGSVLLSIVPENEQVVAEVVVRNEDIGFVHPDQPVKVKVASYAFQKYGMLDGKVRQVWPDAADAESPSRSAGATRGNAASDPAAEGFKALIDLKAQHLPAFADTLRLVPGMHVTVEINQGRQTVLEYLLSPILKVAQEGARER
jgi:HlyD family secretion protein